MARAVPSNAPFLVLRNKGLGKDFPDARLRGAWLPDKVGQKNAGLRLAARVLHPLPEREQLQRWPELADQTLTGPRVSALAAVHWLPVGNA